jgi:cytochrome oxidase Cu insertion factor (SCO1/SenC/PrrC family)
MINIKPISMRVLFGLVLLLSVWFFVWSAKSYPAKDQTEIFNTNSVMSNVNKETGLPDPGTYKLQKIFRVPQLTVLDSKGMLQPISKYTEGKITLLTFFYDRCNDADGCPYAMALFHRVKSQLEKDNKTLDSVRLVNISFDPERDTPMMMASLEKRSRSLDGNKKNIEWHFLTTKSVNDLMPVVDAFGQNVDINMSTITNSKTLSYSHVLKVFLIDGDGYVREIYSTAYLNKDILLNDIQTLDLEALQIK